MDKIRLAYFTSFRELIGDEGVSTIVSDEETGQSYGYRMGNLEHLARMFAVGGHPFTEQFDIGMVFSDDSDGHVQEARQRVISWPLQIEVPVAGTEGKYVPLEDLLVRVPSEPWRKIPTGDPSKFKAKMIYEAEIVRALQERAIDLVVSDSYTPLFDKVLLGEYRGRMVNIHPAITDKSSSFRLPGLTPTRDAYTRARYGFIIVDDKKKRETWPEGESKEIEYKGKKRLAVEVPKCNVTGVTVHVINERVDDGPVIMQLEYSFDPTSSYEHIRNENYALKRKLLPDALVHYVNRDDVRQLISTGSIKAQVRSKG